MRAWNAWARFSVGSNCRAWLLRILTNSFINRYRKQRRRRRFINDDQDEAVMALHASARERCHDPKQHMVQDQLGDEVRSALTMLGPEYRTVVELADLRGVRYRDIADKLGLPIGTVMSRLFRARRQLESRLADYARSDYGIQRGAAMA